MLHRDPFRKKSVRRPLIETLGPVVQQQRKDLGPIFQRLKRHYYCRWKCLLQPRQAAERRPPSTLAQSGRLFVFSMGVQEYQGDNVGVEMTAAASRPGVVDSTNMIVITRHATRESRVSLACVESSWDCAFHTRACHENWEMLTT
jgi:hypothetical protein